VQTLASQVVHFAIIIAALSLIAFVLKTTVRVGVALILLLLVQFLAAVVADQLGMFGPGMKLALLTFAAMALLWALRKGVLWAVTPLVWIALVVLLVALFLYALVPQPVSFIRGLSAAPNSMVSMHPVRAERVNVD
jgi:hypothetical protein